MNNPMTPAQALQLISEALEPTAQGKISRSGYIAIQQAIETLAQAIKPNAESDSEPSA